MLVWNQWLKKPFYLVLGKTPGMGEKARSSPGCGTGQKIDGGGKRKLNTRGVPGRRLPGFCGREKTPVKGVKRIGHYTRE